MKLKTPNPLVFVLFVALIIWPANFIIHALKRPNPHAQKLRAIVQSDAFLMGLNNKAGDGCIALKYMGDVDVIIIGSSHAYASIDPYVLKKMLGDKRVALCAVPVWNTDFLRPFMQFLDKEHIRSKQLLWISDGAVPLQIGQHAKRLEYAKSIFLDPTTQKKMTEKWMHNIEKALPPLGLSKEGYTLRQQVHKTKIAHLSLGQVKKRLKTFRVLREGNLPAVLKTAKINPKNKNNLEQFCRDLNRQGTALDIVVAPVPLATAKIIQNHRPSSAYATLQNFFQANVPCARNIIAQPLEDWGLDERYFINRGLQTDFPYENWQALDGFEEVYENWPKRSKAYFYSPDHMNPVGAVLFSERLAESIESWF